MDDQVLRPNQASVYIGLARSTLAKRRVRGDPPEFIKLGVRAVGYTKRALDNFVAERTRRSTSDAKCD